MQAISPAISRLGVRPVPVAIYTRVSTIDQVGGRFDSCESQEELARQHIERNAQKGYYLSGVFPDPAYSGGSMKRPGMQALMRHIEAGHAEVVLIYKFRPPDIASVEMSAFCSFGRWTQIRGKKTSSCLLVLLRLELQFDAAIRAQIGRTDFIPDDENKIRAGSRGDLLCCGSKCRPPMRQTPERRYMTS